MNQATLAWTAFKNMMWQAARDPIWAIVQIVISPFRGGAYLAKVGLGFILIATVLYLIPYLAIPETWVAARWIAGAVVTAILAIFLFRILINPMIQHFGKPDGETHGTARFASNKEVAPLTCSRVGLLIGRDGKTGKLLRYDRPAHLLTMAP